MTVKDLQSDPEVHFRGYLMATSNVTGLMKTSTGGPSAIRTAATVHVTAADIAMPLSANTVRTDTETPEAPI